MVLILLLTGQAVASYASGGDDDLLTSGFGIGFGPQGNGSITLRNDVFPRKLVVQNDDKVIVVGSLALVTTQSLVTSG